MAAPPAGRKKMRVSDKCARYGGSWRSVDGHGEKRTLSAGDIAPMHVCSVTLGRPLAERCNVKSHRNRWLSIPTCRSCAGLYFFVLPLALSKCDNCSYLAHAALAHADRGSCILSMWLVFDLGVPFIYRRLLLSLLNDCYH